MDQPWWKDYFTVHKKERTALLLFIIFVGCCIFLPRWLARPQTSLALRQDPVLILAIDTLEKRKTREPDDTRQNTYDRGNSSYQYETSQTNSFTNGELFAFDPNTISLHDWQRLGLNERTSRTILKYVSKGGRFYKPEDLLKIWGMPEGFYERVKDFIAIDQPSKKYTQENVRPEFKREKRVPVAIDINGADTTAFIALPGIGSKLSARIVAFREKLGGFYSVEQVGETYGLPDSTFQKIKPRLRADADAVRKINVNAATKDELKIHPYIRWNLANAIVEYRNQHGAFKSLEDLKNIVLIDDATFSRIYHYLSL